MNDTQRPSAPGVVDPEPRVEPDEVVRLRGVLGDLIDVLGDEMKLEVSRMSYVIEKVRDAIDELGPEYQSYLSAWWLGGDDV